MNDDDDDDDCSNSWSELHEDMIHQIFKKLTSAADCMRFGSVCVSWRSIPFAYLHPDLLHPQLPLLMIPTPPQLLLTKEEEEQKRSFYSVSERSVYKPDIKISLPHKGRSCRGSSHGWIITTLAQEDIDGYSVEMFNPFISVINNNNNGEYYYQKIQLPPLTEFGIDQEIYGMSGAYTKDYLYKAIVSVNPSSHPRDYVVMAIFGANVKGRLGFWRPGDQVWTYVSGRLSYLLEDVIYYKGLFYAVDQIGTITVIDLNDDDCGAPPSVTRLNMAPRPIICTECKKYLVESAGDLLLVCKGGWGHDVEDRLDGNDTIFRVLKLMTAENGAGTGTGTGTGTYKWDDVLNTSLGTTTYKWEFLNTLPGRMLFLGDNESISFATSDFPRGKSSCIYYTDDYTWVIEEGDDPSNERYLHSGIYSMEENKTIERFSPIGEYFSPVNNIWVEPTLRCCFRL